MRAILGRDYFSKSNVAAFTLIELLAAVAIVGVLSVSLVFVVNPGAQLAKTRDAQRKNDLEQIKNALDIYYGDYNQYPLSLSALAADVNGQIYIKKVPQDPLNTQSYCYEVSDDNSMYRLNAKLERSSDLQINPDITCDTKIYNYAVTSTNTSVVAYGMPTPTIFILPTPTSAPTPTPTPTRTPTPTIAPTPTPTPTPILPVTTTFYPSLDGLVAQEQFLPWADLVAAAGNGRTDDAAQDYFFYTYASSNSEQWLLLYRAIVLFDTSALPDSAVISAATLSVYGISRWDGLYAAPNINVYSSAPASNTALAGGDYDSLGSTAFSTAITYAGFSTTGYNNFTLNSNGIAAINKTGVSKFGLRNANYDVAATSPIWAQQQGSFFRGYFSEQGTGYKPKLVVTYQ